MRMRLAGAVSEGSGPCNEDGFGFTGTADDVCAAWVFDGVTGINGRPYLPGVSDAQWFVRRASSHLNTLALGPTPLADILKQLVGFLTIDFAEATAGVTLPADFDPPAACLVLAKRYGARWEVLRLGDSALVSRAAGQHMVAAESPNNALDRWLVQEAQRRSLHGAHNLKALLADFRPQLQAARQRRNRPDGYSILEASEASLAMPEYHSAAEAESILLCTDGFYRAVDLYGLCQPDVLLQRCGDAGGVEAVLAAVRQCERDDADCTRFPRFKPADDATALCLVAAP